MKKNYKVYLWCGCGYYLDTCEVMATNEEEALKMAAKNIGWKLNVEGLSEDEFDDYLNDDRYVYLDDTENDNGCYFLLIENARIEEIE